MRRELIFPYVIFVIFKYICFCLRRKALHSLGSEGESDLRCKPEIPGEARLRIVAEQSRNSLASDISLGVAQLRMSLG